MCDKNELQSLVAHYFCQGIKPSKIIQKLEADHGLVVKKTAWQVLAEAAADGRFRYFPHPATRLEESIRKEYRGAGIDRIDIVSSLTLGDVAFRAAEVLLAMLREHHRGKIEAHIGFAGGGTLLEIARALSTLLRDPDWTHELPKKLVFHSMVAGWNVDQPETDPNSFSTVLVGDQDLLDVDIRFVGLHAPGMVQPSRYKEFMGLVGIKEAFDAIEQIDVIVTSGGRWNCGHSALHRLYGKYCEKMLGPLAKSQCVGDLMWCPLGPNGQIDLKEIEAPLQTFTLMQISQLHDFILNQRKHVLLALGPCSQCNEPKSEILKTILDLAPKQRFFTHLVCDSRTASRVLP
jgi:hypothetical protein